MRTLSSASSGRCNKISMGSVSAAIITIAEMPRLSVLVAACKAQLVKLGLSLANSAPQMLLTTKCLHSMIAQTRTLVRALLQLLVVDSLLDNVQYGVGQLHGHHC